MKKLILLTVTLLLAAAAWGQSAAVEGGMINFNMLCRVRDDLAASLDSTLNRLDRISARLDKLEANQPAPSRLKWTVEVDTIWLDFYDKHWFDREDWWLCLAIGKRKFRVCKVEEVTE